MSNNKHMETDPERTLLTLDQLSQTIEVMTSVVNRLRQHLSDQILARNAQELEEREKQQLKATQAQQTRDNKLNRDSKNKPNPEVAAENPNAERVVAEGSSPASAEDRESFVVEITQPETESQPKGNKTLH